MTFSALVPPTFVTVTSRGRPPLAGSPASATVTRRSAGPRGPESPLTTSPTTTARMAASETTSSAHSNGVRSRPMPRLPGGSLRGHMSNRPSAAPIEAGNASVTTRAVAAPFRASTRPNMASIAAETTNATA